MYSFFKGKFINKTPTSCVVECQGVGYELHISLTTYTAIQSLEEGLIFSYLNVKEDALTLWGFADMVEKEVFVQLISVSGIGPNTARMMLSSMNAQEVGKAISSGNVALIQAIKGIGPKTAQRVILELKDKILKSATISSHAPSLNIESSVNISSEAVSALCALGFSKSSSEQAILKAMKQLPNASVEDLIKLALKMI